MAPVLLDLGFFKLYGYGTMIAIGVLTASVFAIADARRRKLPRFEHCFPWLFCAIGAFAFLGGKGLWWIMSNAQERAATDSGAGFTYFGAVLLEVPGTMLTLRWMRIPVLPATDLLGMMLPLTHAFGRLGCFLAGCCYGCRTESALAVRFSDGIGLNGVNLHPVQLYEVGANFAIFAALWFWLRHKSWPHGTLFAVTLILTGLSRMITECFRGDVPAALWGNLTPAPGEAAGGITQAQAIGALTVAAGCAGLLWLRRRKVA